MVYIKKTKVLGKTLVKNKNKNKNKNVNTQVQNLHLHINEKPKRKRVSRTTKPKPKPQQQTELSPYDLMIYRQTQLQPSYSYNLPINERLQAQTPEYAKQIEKLLTEFKNTNSRIPIFANNIETVPSDEEKLKNFNLARKEYNNEKQNKINEYIKKKQDDELNFDYMTSPLKDNNKYDMQEAIPFPKFYSPTGDLIEATIKKPVGRPRHPQPINPMPKNPVGRPRHPQPINQMPKNQKRRPKKQFKIDKSEEI